MSENKVSKYSKITQEGLAKNAAATGISQKQIMEALKLTAKAYNKWLKNRPKQRVVTLEDLRRPHR